MIIRSDRRRRPEQEQPPRPPDCRPSAGGVWGPGASHVPAAPVLLFDPCGNGPVSDSSDEKEEGT